MSKWRATFTFLLSWLCGSLLVAGYWALTVRFARAPSWVDLIVFVGCLALASRWLEPLAQHMGRPQTLYWMFLATCLVTDVLIIAPVLATTIPHVSSSLIWTLSGISLMGLGLVVLALLGRVTWQVVRGNAAIRNFVLVWFCSGLLGVGYLFFALVFPMMGWGRVQALIGPWSVLVLVGWLIVTSFWLDPLAQRTRKVWTFCKILLLAPSLTLILGLPMLVSAGLATTPPWELNVLAAVGVFSVVGCWAAVLALILCVVRQVLLNKARQILGGVWEISRQRGQVLFRPFQSLEESHYLPRLWRSLRRWLVGGVTLALVLDIVGILLILPTAPIEWKPAPSTGISSEGLPASSPGPMQAMTVGPDEQSLFAGANGIVFRSVDDGRTWRPISHGLGNKPVQVLAADSDGTSVLAGTCGDGILIWSDNNQTWRPANEGLTDLNVQALIVGPDRIFAGTQGGVFRSDNGGRTWQSISQGLTDLGIAALILRPDHSLFAGTYNGLYRSDEGGQTWHQVIQDPKGRGVRALATGPDGISLFAGTYSNILRSDDGGLTWRSMGEGLADVEVRALAAGAKGLFAGTSGGVFRSDDEGQTWYLISGGLADLDVRSLVLGPDKKSLFAGTSSGGIYRSDEGGQIWRRVDKGLTSPGLQVLVVGPDGKSLYLGTESGILRSDDQGQSWQSISDQHVSDVQALVVRPTGRIIAGTSNGIWGSDDGGQTWNRTYDPNPSDGLFGWGREWLQSDSSVRALVGTENGTLFLATTDGIFRSVDGGKAWHPLYSGLGRASVRALAIGPDDKSLFVIASDGVFRSDDGGQTWRSVGEGLLNVDTRSLVFGANKKSLFAGTDGGVFRSDDSGRTWLPVNEGLADKDVRSLVLGPNKKTLFAWTESGRIFGSDNEGQSWQRVDKGLPCSPRGQLAVGPGGKGLVANIDGSIFHSDDEGQFWSSVDHGMNTWEGLGLWPQFNLNTRVLAVDAERGSIYATSEDGIFRSDNGGKTWRPVYRGLCRASVQALAVGPDGKSLFAETFDGVSRSDDGGQTWHSVEESAGVGMRSFVLGPNRRTLFATTAGRISRSDDGGQTWQPIAERLADHYVYSLVLGPTGKSLFAGTDGGLFRSDDEGQTWQSVGDGWSSLGLQSLILGPNGKSFFAHANSGVFRSDDEGQSWMPVSEELSSYVFALAAKPGTSLFAGASGVFRSDDQGQTWRSVSEELAGGAVTALTVEPNGQDLFIGTPGGVLRSGDQGQTWQPANEGLADLQAWSLVVGSNGKSLFAGTSGGVFRSDDEGQTWQPANEGLADLQAWSLVVGSNGKSLFAGTSGGVFRSDDEGQTWRTVGVGQIGEVRSLVLGPNGQSLFAGTAEGVVRSDDEGQTWRAVNKGLAAIGARSHVLRPNGKGLIGLASSRGLHPNVAGQTWLAGGGWSGALSLAIGPDGKSLLASTENGVLRSDDEGSSWRPVIEKLSDVQTLVAGPGKSLFVGTSHGVLRSDDEGLSWHSVGELASLQVRSFVQEPSGMIFFVGTSSGVFRSDDRGQTWHPVNQGLADMNVQVLVMEPGGERLYAGTSSGIFRSDDGSKTWRLVGQELANVEIRSLVLRPNDKDLFAGTSRGFFRSDDEGQTWQAANEGLVDLDVRSVALGPNGKTLFIGTTSGQVLHSNDGGQTWLVVNEQWNFPGLQSLTIGMGGKSLLVKTEDTTYRSDDEGQSWYNVTEGAPEINVLVAGPEGSLLAGTSNGVWRSDDKGQTWYLTSNGLVDEAYIENNLHVHALLAGPDGVGLFAATDNGIFYSRDDGKTWQHTGPGSIPVQALVAGPDGKSFYAEVLGGQVYRADNRGWSWQLAQGLSPQNIPRGAAFGDVRMLADKGKISLSRPGIDWMPWATYQHQPPQAIVIQGDHAILYSLEGRSSVMRAELPLPLMWRAPNFYLAMVTSTLRFINNAASTILVVLALGAGIGFAALISVKLFTFRPRFSVADWLRVELGEWPGAYWMFVLWITFGAALVSLPPRFLGPLYLSIRSKPLESPRIVNGILPIAIMSAVLHWLATRSTPLGRVRQAVIVASAIVLAIGAYVATANPTFLLQIFGVQVPAQIYDTVAGAWQDMVVLAVFALAASRSRHLWNGWKALVVGCGAGTALVIVLAYPVYTLTYTAFVPGSNFTGLAHATAVIIYGLLGVLLALSVGPIVVRWSLAQSWQERLVKGVVAGTLAGGFLFGELGASVAGVAAQSPLYGVALSRVGYNVGEWILKLAIGVNQVFPTTYSAFWLLIGGGGLTGGLTALLTKIPRSLSSEVSAMPQAWPPIVLIIALPLFGLSTLVHFVILVLLGPAVQNLFNTYGVLPGWRPEWMLTGVVIPMWITLIVAQALGLLWFNRQSTKAHSGRLVAAFAVYIGLIDLSAWGWLYSLYRSLDVFEAPSLLAPLLCMTALGIEMLIIGRRLWRCAVASDAPEPPPPSRSVRVGAGVGGGIVVAVFNHQVVAALLSVILVAIALIPEMANLTAVPPGVKWLEEKLSPLFYIHQAAFMTQIVLLSMIGAGAGLTLGDWMWRWPLWLWLRFKAIFRWIGPCLAFLRRRRLAWGMLALGIVVVISVASSQIISPVLLTFLTTMVTLVVFPQQLLERLSWPVLAIAFAVTLIGALILAMQSVLGMFFFGPFWRPVYAPAIGPAIGITYQALATYTSDRLRPVMRLVMLVGMALLIGVMSEFSHYYILSEGGVSHYDGERWENFASGNSAISGQMNYQFFEDNQKQLWLGGASGVIVKRAGGQWLPYPVVERQTTTGSAPQTRKLDAPSWFVQDRQGRIWVAQDRLFGQFDPATLPVTSSVFLRTPSWHQGNQTTSLSLNSAVTGLTTDMAGDLWLATAQDGVIRLRGDRAPESAYWESYTTNNSTLTSNNIRIAYADKMGRLWFGTDGGVSRFDGTNWETVNLPGSSNNALVNTFLEDSKRDMWVGTTQGGYWWDGQTWRPFEEKLGWPNGASVEALFEDSRGGIWAGTSKGVLQLDERGWNRRSSVGGVTKFVEGPPDVVWAGGKQGLVRFTSTAEKPELFDSGNSGLATNWVQDLYVDRDWTLWVSTYRSEVTVRSPWWAMGLSVLFFGYLFTHTYRGYNHAPETRARRLARGIATEPDRLYPDVYALFASTLDAPDVLARSVRHLDRSGDRVGAGVTAALSALSTASDVDEALDRSVAALENDRSRVWAAPLKQLHGLLAHVLAARQVSEIATLELSVNPSHEAGGISLQARAQSVGELPSFLPAGTAEAWRALEQVARILRKYQDVDSARDRLAYLGDALLAVEQAQTATGSVKPPEGAIMATIARYWREAVNEEINLVSGQAKLRLELRTRQVRRADLVTLALRLHNAGRAPAESVVVTLQPSSSFTPDGEARFTTGLLSSDRSVPVEFVIAPGSDETIRIVCRVTWNDRVAEGKTLEFADTVSFYQVEEEFRTIANPYIVGPPVKSPEMFQGREDVFHFIEENLSGPVQGRALLLHGQRRTGKTSILYQLLAGRLGQDFLPVLIDMQEVAPAIKSTGDFLSDMAYQLARSASKAGVQIKEPGIEAFIAAPVRTFSRFLDELEERLGNRHIVVMLDEFELIESKIVEGKLEADLPGYIRSLVQHRDRLLFIFVGTHQLEEMSRDYWSAFFNVALYRRISFLGQADAAQLIRKPVVGALDIDELAVEKIFQLTKGHPYFTQLICWALVNYCNTQRRNYATVNDVDESVLEIITTGEAYFAYIWQQATNNERLALAGLAHTLQPGKAWAQPSEILETLVARGDKQTQQAALVDTLDRLVEHEVLEAAGEGALRYRFQMEVLKLWIEKTKSITAIVERGL